MRRSSFAAGLFAFSLLAVAGTVGIENLQSSRFSAQVVHNTFIGSPTSLPAGGGNVSLQWQYDQPTWNGNGAVIDYGGFNCVVKNQAGVQVAASTTSFSGQANVRVSASNTFTLTCSYRYYAAGSWTDVGGPSGTVSVTVAQAASSSPTASSAGAGGGTGGNGGTGGTGDVCGDGICSTTEKQKASQCAASLTQGKTCNACWQDCGGGNSSVAPGTFKVTLGPEGNSRGIGSNGQALNGGTSSLAYPIDHGSALWDFSSVSTNGAVPYCTFAASGMQTKKVSGVTASTDLSNPGTYTINCGYDSASGFQPIFTNYTVKFSMGGGGGTSSQQSSAPPPPNCNLSQCNDGIDNDGDGLVDMQDPGCQDTYDNTEQDTVTPLTGGTCVILDQDSSGSGTINVNCPAGYLSVGGGWKNYGVNDDMLDPSRPLPNNAGWQCGRLIPGSPAQCSAICCSAQVVDVQTVTQNGILRGNLQPQCPAGYDLTGGGFLDAINLSSGKKKDMDIFRPEESDKWHCFNDDSSIDGSSCYAICAKRKDAEPMSCVTIPADVTNGNLIDIHCPKGTTITGGGFIDNSTGNDDTDTSGPYSDNRWICESDHGDSTVVPNGCYARCCTLPSPVAGTGSVQCRDGIDNDHDGSTDLNDFSCGGNPNHLDEGTPVAQCQDGIDNDGDGKIDMKDDGCKSPQDNDEHPDSSSSTTSSASSASSVSSALSGSSVSSASSVSSSRPSSSSSQQSSSSSQKSGLSESSSAAACAPGACADGGDAFCAISNQTCADSDAAPCFVCSGTASSAACGGDTCATGGNDFCALQNETCQESDQAPCFVCAAKTVGSCSGNTCATGGTDFCALQNASCTESDTSPCFACSGATANACNGTTCASGGAAFCSLQNKFCQESGTSPCFVCGDTPSSAGVSLVWGWPASSSSAGLVLGLSDEEPGVVATCGNGQKDLNEECDGGAQNGQPGSRCRKNCTLIRCGDGIVDKPSEECDDGNQVSGDGCSAACVREQPGAVSVPLQPGAPQQVTILPVSYPAHSPVGATGPGSLAVMAAGAASGLAYMRKKVRKSPDVLKKE